MAGAGLSFPRASDDRCRRDVFLQFLLERLEAWSGLAAETPEAAKERQGLGELRQIGLLLARVSPNRLILLLDGLDEIDRLDPSIADAVLPQLRGSGVCWSAPAGPSRGCSPCVTVCGRSSRGRTACRR
jgi:hypothetical protein